jgi:hypothetical protein
VKKIDALAKDLSFMIGFNSQTLSRVQPSQPLLQDREQLVFARRFFLCGFHFVSLAHFMLHGGGSVISSRLHCFGRAACCRSRRQTVLGGNGGWLVSALNKHTLNAWEEIPALH